MPAKFCGLRKSEVLDRSQHEDRILITFDKDFGELAFRLKLPSLSGIILITVYIPIIILAYLILCLTFQK